MGKTEVIHPVVALFAPTDPVAQRGTLSLHLLVMGAEVVAVQTSGQEVPQLSEVATSARRALCRRGSGTVSDHMMARFTHLASEGFPGKGILVFVGGRGTWGGEDSVESVDDFREQEQHSQGKLWRREHYCCYSSCMKASLSLYLGFNSGTRSTSAAQQLLERNNNDKDLKLYMQ